MATITLADRILKFFNTVNDKYEIRYRIKDDPNFGSAPASGYGIDLSVAQNILDARANLTDPPNPVPNPANEFDRIEQIDDVDRVGPVTLHNILYSFSEPLRTWTASADGQRVGTLKDVGIGTLVAEERLQVYDGALSVKSYRDTPVRVATLPTPGTAFDVFVLGNYAYMAEGSKFTVVDISDPAGPTLLGNNITLNDARGVFVSGAYAYVADGTDGLQIIDISDPANSSLVSTQDTGGNARGVYVVGDYAYVADGPIGLRIVDISDPANPSLGPLYDNSAHDDTKGGSAEDVYVAGDYAFIANGPRGLAILDISDPANPPILVSSFDTIGDCRCVYIHGDRAYVADGSKGFQILDISNPVVLVSVGSLDTTQGQADDIFVSGSHAYVANGVVNGISGLLQVFDISDLANPDKLVDNFLVPGGDARGIFVSGQHAYVADRNQGLVVYHVLNTNRIGDNSHFSGNVGIGTTSPGHTLDVNGNFRIRSGHQSKIELGKWSEHLSVTDSIKDRFLFRTYRSDPSGANLAYLRILDEDGETVKAQISSNWHGGRYPTYFNNRVGIGTGTPGGKLHVHGAARGQDALGLVLTKDGGGPRLHFNEYGRVASILWHNNYLLVSSGTGTNIGRILLYGDVYATGRSGASCDYAEYFESTSGKTIPAGTAVVLEDGKIRQAKKNETPIGVISANPGLVGGAHIEWPKKYLRDEFGALIMEEYQAEITAPKKNEDGTDAFDENGQYIMLGTGEFETRKRSKLNPEYDENQEYTPREQRPEWNCVGLLGQLPLRKGQPVAESWVKIKDISDKVELWLVK